jgi:hypothetical protein
MGQETVRILVSEDVTNISHGPRTGSFTVHKQLLARFSGHFRTLFGDFIDRKIIYEVVNEIVASEGTSLLKCSEEPPAGYTHPFAVLAEELRATAADETGHGDVKATCAEEVYELLDEQACIFNIFVHWLYTQQLPPSKAKDFFGDTLAKIYGLAERLDVPLLRQQCYEEIRQSYQDNLPTATAVQVVVQQTCETSILHKYFVGLFAHAVIDKFERETVNEVLDSYPDFAHEVSDHVFSRLLGDDNIDPREDLCYATDDSDSDYATSWEEDSELESDLDYDSAGYMSLSEAEDNDLLVDDEDEDPENIESHDNSTPQAATDTAEPNVRSKSATVTPEVLQVLPDLAINPEPKAATARIASDGGSKRKRETSPFDNPYADGAADSVRRKTQVIDLTE